MKALRSSLAVAVLLVSASVASAITINDINTTVGGVTTVWGNCGIGCIQIGDKEFSDITQNSYLTNSQVNVVGSVEGGTVFIDFQAGWDTGEAGGSFDFLLTYTVDTASGEATIDTIDQRIVGTPGLDGGSIVVSEQVYPDAVSEAVGVSNLAITGDTIDPPGEANDTLVLIDGPYSHLEVVKDIDLNAGSNTDATGITSLSSIRQSFHQTSEIPEPATIFLLGSGLLGLGGLGRRRAKRS